MLRKTRAPWRAPDAIDATRGTANTALKAAVNIPIVPIITATGWLRYSSTTHTQRQQRAVQTRAGWRGPYQQAAIIPYTARSTARPNSNRARATTISRILAVTEQPSRERLRGRKTISQPKSKALEIMQLDAAKK